MKRRRRRVRSLTGAEVARVEEGVRSVLGRELVGLAQSRGISLADTIRLNALGAAFAAARQDRGLTLKDAASAIAAPQYRVRAIERGNRREILPEVLRAYVAFLGLTSQVEPWARQHPKLAASLDLLPRKRPRPAAST